MADNPTDIPSAQEAVTDSFGPPHRHTVSNSLHLWIILPGLVLIAFIGYMLYKLFRAQTEKKRKREEKKKLRQERKDKKKAK